MFSTSWFGAPINLLATSVFGLTCFLFGAAVGAVLHRRARPRQEWLPPLHWYEEDAIDQAAQTWAESRGLPHHARIAASYLKLGTRLQRRSAGVRW